MPAFEGVAWSVSFISLAVSDCAASLDIQAAPRMDCRGMQGSKVWRQLGMAWMNWWSTWINSNFLVYLVYLVLLYSNISNSPGLVEQVPPKHCFCNYCRDLIRVWMDNCRRSGAPSRPPETSLSTRLWMSFRSLSHLSPMLRLICAATSMSVPRAAHKLKFAGCLQPHISLLCDYIQ